MRILNTEDLWKSPQSLIIVEEKLVEYTETTEIYSEFIVTVEPHHSHLELVQGHALVGHVGGEELVEADDDPVLDIRLSQMILRYSALTFSNFISVSRKV